MADGFRDILLEARKNKLSAIWNAISDAEVTRIWEAISALIHRTLSIQQRGLTVPGLATFTLSKVTLDVGGNKILTLQRPLCVINEKLAMTHQLKGAGKSGDVTVVPLNFTQVGLDAHLSRDHADVCVKETAAAISRMIAAKRSVQLTLDRVGCLNIRSGKVKMRFFRGFVDSVDGSGRVAGSLRCRPGTEDSVMSDGRFGGGLARSILFNPDGPGALPRIHESLEGLEEELQMSDSIHHANVLNVEAERRINDEPTSIERGHTFQRESTLASINGHTLSNNHGNDNDETLDATEVNDNQINSANKASDGEDIVTLQDVINVEDPRSFEESDLNDSVYNNITKDDDHMIDVEVKQPYRTAVVLDSEIGEKDEIYSDYNGSMADENYRDIHNQWTPAFSAGLPNAGNPYGSSVASSCSSLGHRGIRRAFDERSVSSDDMFAAHRSARLDRFTPASLPTRPQSACSHASSGGQELCYVCYQRAHRVRLDSGAVEERKRREAAEAQAYHDQEVAACARQATKEKEWKMKRMEEERKDVEFNQAAMREAARVERQGRNEVARPVFIFRRRPLTPPKVVKQEMVRRELERQIAEKEEAERRQKEENENYEFNEKVRLGKLLEAERDEKYRQRAVKRDEYLRDLTSQMLYKAEQLNREHSQTSSDAAVEPYFVRRNLAAEAVERRRHAEALNRDRLAALQQAKRDSLLKRLSAQKREEEEGRKASEQLKKDQERSREVRLRHRQSLTNNWIQAMREKGLKDVEDKQGRVNCCGAQILDQCERYLRCRQCKRKLSNMGASNILPSTRIMV